MIDRRLVIAMFVLAASAAQAQVESIPLRPLPLGDVLLTLPTSHMPEQGTW